MGNINDRHPPPPLAPASGATGSSNLSVRPFRNLRSTPATRVAVSRQYVIPPRPKPGRKPKPKDNRRASSPKHANTSGQDTDCGLCERDECLCQDLGIKDKRVQTESELATEITMDSIRKQELVVPLKRQPDPSVRKFKRASASVEDMLSPSNLKPTFKLKLDAGVGCGFCTANSPCVCAESEQDAKVPAVTPAVQEHVPQPTAPTLASEASTPHTSPSLTPSEEVIDYGCSSCQNDPMSMLFCVSLGSSQQLPQGAVAIPCTMAHRTIIKHPKFSQCDLGQIIMMLESKNKMIGIQSVNRVLQYLNDL